MRAIAIETFGGRDRLCPMELDRPVTGPGEILIRIVAAGVNPVDWKIREGLLSGAFPHDFPLVPGWDAAGVVEELGEGTSRLRKGDRVWTYARKPRIQGGTYAEYVVVPEASAAPMPANLLFEEAASVPLAALTAYQSLFVAARVAAETTVLIHAASGGVGHFAAQLAKNAGARVIGTAGPSNQEFVLAQGAEAAVDYTRQDFREAVRARYPDGVDVVLDTIGGDTLDRSWEIVKPGGIVVGIVDVPDASRGASRGVRSAHVFVEPDGAQLRLLAALAEKKKLRPQVQKIFPLSEAAQAHAAIEAGHVRGKIVLAL